MKRKVKENQKGEKTRKTLKNNLGITLIALVITIIVLLILAGVSIAMLTGENGIITQANKAKEENKKMQEKELKILTEIEATMSLKNEIYIDKNNEKVTVPAGFAVSPIESENTIKDGLVIIDDNGNEFVWIPVKDINEFNRYDGYMHKIMQNKSMKIQLGVSDFFLKLKEPYDITGNISEKEEYSNMKNSVLKHKGFYVARYEAAKDENSENKIVSKQGKKVWNNTKWGESMTEIGTEGAVYQARQMYKENRYGVKSTLIYGVQWDAIMQWISPEYKNEDGTLYDKNSFVANSKEKGNYKEKENKNEWYGKVALTGANINYKQKNIYDLGGNVAEWTMETYDNNQRIARGGNFYNNGTDYPASERNPAYPQNNIVEFGFRVALFIK